MIRPVAPAFKPPPLPLGLTPRQLEVLHHLAHGAVHRADRGRARNPARDRPQPRPWDPAGAPGPLPARGGRRRAAAAGCSPIDPSCVYAAAGAVPAPCTSGGRWPRTTSGRDKSDPARSLTGLDVDAPEPPRLRRDATRRAAASRRRGPDQRYRRSWPRTRRPPRRCRLALPDRGLLTDRAQPSSRRHGRPTCVDGASSTGARAPTSAAGLRAFVRPARPSDTATAPARARPRGPPPAALEHDPGEDRHAAEPLEPVQVLGEDQGREDRGDERLDVREQRRPRRPDPVDGGEPEDVRQEQRPDDREREADPDEVAERRVVLVGDLGRAEREERNAHHAEHDRADPVRRVAAHQRRDRHRVAAHEIASAIASRSPPRSADRSPPDPSATSATPAKPTAVAIQNRAVSRSSPTIDATIAAKIGVVPRISATVVAELSFSA